MQVKSIYLERLVEPEELTTDVITSNGSELFKLFTY
jgi:hypothetical protein